MILKILNYKREFENQKKFYIWLANTSCLLILVIYHEKKRSLTMSFMPNSCLLIP